MRFSLVIPVAPDRKAEIIESIKKLDYPREEIKVIVVRGLSPSRNRNKGASHSNGEIISFLDDDAVLEPNFLKNADNFFIEHPEIDIAGGPQLTPKDDSEFAKISGYALCSKFGAWNLASRYSKGKLNLDVDEQMITSANLFCRREVMDKVKFDPLLFPGEDPKFIDDAKKAGFKIAYCPDFVVYHRRRANVRGLAKQIFNYGKVRPAKESFFSTLKKPFFLGPSLFLIYLVFIFGFFIAMNFSMTGAVTGAYKFSFPEILFLPLLVYIILAILFGVYDSVKNKNVKAVFVLPVIYPVIHLSYGAGMIFGYLRKLKNKISA